MVAYFERGLGARIYGEHREDIGRFNLLGESANLLDQLSLIDKTKPLHFCDRKDTHFKQILSV